MAGLAKKPEDRPATCAAVLEGDGFSRVEHVERVEDGRAGAPRPPRWDENTHAERTEGKAHDDGEGKVSRKKAIWLVALMGLAVIGGLWWWSVRCTPEARAKAEWEKRARKGADVGDNGHTKVQLWEGGPRIEKPPL